MGVSPIPVGYHAVIPYLIVRGAAAALEFYTRALGAVELFRVPGPGGQIGHAEMRLRDAVVMLADEHPQMGAHAPEKYGGSPVSLLLYVPDVDALFARAVAAGAIVVRPLQNQFYGDRSGTIKDPFGHTWTLATHIEDVSPEEIARRTAEMSSATS